MPGRSFPFLTDNIYHLFNRGSDKRDLFLQPRDYKRFQQTFYYYQFKGPKPKFSKFTKSKLNLFRLEQSKKLVEVWCYCLMPNHFHFLIKQLKDDGISVFISQLINSYTKYFNTKYDRVGPLLQGRFKAVPVESEEQLLHLSRYIHINPVVSGICKDPIDYPWTSYQEHLTGNGFLSNPQEILNYFPKGNYQQFVKDQIDYGTTLELLKHQIIEDV